MSLQEAASQVGRRATKFCPANVQKIKDWVAEGISREEIAKSLGVTLGSLQVTCSRLGISLRRQDLLSSKGPGRPRTVSSPSAPSIVGQMQAGRPRLYIALECNGRRQTTELPLTTAIGQLKLEAEMRKLSMGQLLAEVATMAIKKGMIEEILREPAQERAPPLQREKLIAEPVGLQNFA
jgi:hypothetical protein